MSKWLGLSSSFIDECQTLLATIWTNTDAALRAISSSFDFPLTVLYVRPSPSVESPMPSSMSLDSTMCAQCLIRPSSTIPPVDP